MASSFLRKSEARKADYQQKRFFASKKSNVEEITFKYESGIEHGNGKTEVGPVKVLGHHRTLLDVIKGKSFSFEVLKHGIRIMADFLTFFYIIKLIRKQSGH